MGALATNTTVDYGTLNLVAAAETLSLPSTVKDGNGNVTAQSDVYSGNSIAFNP